MNKLVYIILRLYRSHVTQSVHGNIIVSPSVYTMVSCIARNIPCVRCIMSFCHHIGMAGKDEMANAMLEGASDHMRDIFAKIMQWYYAKDDQKVHALFVCC